MSMCSELKPIPDIEGFSQVGLVRRAQIEKCGKNRSRIVVELVNGKTVCGPCADEGIVNSSIRVIEHYSKRLKLAREGR